MSAHLSTLVLNQLRYGELEPDAARAARAHLDACARCSARLRAQEQHRAAFELAPVPHAIRKAAAPRPFHIRGRWLFAALALATAGLLATTVVPTLREVAVDHDEVRTKGEVPDLEVWRETRAGPVEVLPGQTVRSGDRIQIRYRKPSAAWVSLVGGSTSGELEVYGSWEADRGSAGWQAAPFALQLDDAPHDERIALVFTPARLSEHALTAMVRRGAAPAGSEIRAVTLVKEAR